jgi:hypothetical protein
MEPERAELIAIILNVAKIMHHIPLHPQNPKHRSKKDWSMS